MLRIWRKNPNSEESSENRETFSVSKFSPATGVRFQRVSQLLLPSCSFPDIRHATNIFSWYKNVISDGFPENIEKIFEIPANRLGFPQIRSVPGKDTVQVVSGRSLQLDFCCYHQSTLINHNSNLSMCGTFLKNLLPPPDICELLSIQNEAYNLNLSAVT